MTEANARSVVRRATHDDLDAMNAVITAAVHAWPLEPRVRRLSAPIL